MLYLNILLACIDQSQQVFAPSKCNVIHCSFIGYYFTACFGLAVHLKMAIQAQTCIKMVSDKGTVNNVALSQMEKQMSGYLGRVQELGILTKLR